MVGPSFKTMKSEFVAWKEAISVKKWWKSGWPTQRILHTAKYEQVVAELGENVHARCHGWTGTGFVWQPAWFEKKLCSVMTSASACEPMWSIEGWIHNKRRNGLAQPNVERTVRVHGNLVLRKTMLLSKQQKVSWDSQTRISEPDRHTNEHVDDSDDDDINSDASTARQDQH